MLKHCMIQEMHCGFQKHYAALIWIIESLIGPPILEVFGFEHACDR
jgi:hypothetical protein